MKFRLALCLWLLIPASAMAQAPARSSGGPPMGAELPPHVVAEVQAREAEILGWLEANDPSTLKRLNRLKLSDPRGYLAHLVRTARVIERAEHDPEVVARHKQMRKLEKQIRELAEGYDELDNKAKKEREAELRTVAASLFDLRQAERRAQITTLEARLTELRNEVEDRQSTREQILDDFVEQQLADIVDL